MDKKYDTSSPKRKAPRSSRGGCARECHVLESMWHFFNVLDIAENRSGERGFDVLQRGRRARFLI